MTLIFFFSGRDSEMRKGFCYCYLFIVHHSIMNDFHVRFFKWVFFPNLNFFFIADDVNSFLLFTVAMS